MSICCSGSPSLCFILFCCYSFLCCCCTVGSINWLINWFIACCVYVCYVHFNKCPTLNTHLTTANWNLAHSGPFVVPWIIVSGTKINIYADMYILQYGMQNAWSVDSFCYSIIPRHVSYRWSVVEVQPELHVIVWPRPSICEISCCGFDQFKGSAYARPPFDQSRGRYKYRTGVCTIWCNQWLKRNGTKGNAVLHLPFMTQSVPSRHFVTMRKKTVHKRDTKSGAKTWMYRSHL